MWKNKFRKREKESKMIHSIETLAVELLARIDKCYSYFFQMGFARIALNRNYTQTQINAEKVLSWIILFKQELFVFFVIVLAKSFFSADLGMCVRFLFV